MKKITYVRVNRAIQEKTVTVSPTKPITKLKSRRLDKRSSPTACVVYKKIALYTPNIYQEVVTIFPLTTPMARRTRLNRDQTLHKNCNCMAKILKIQTDQFHFTNSEMNHASFMARPLTKATLQFSQKNVFSKAILIWSEKIESLFRSNTQ